MTWMALLNLIGRRGHGGLDVRGLRRHHRGRTGCSTPSGSTSSSCSPTSAPGGTSWACDHRGGPRRSCRTSTSPVVDVTSFRTRPAGRAVLRLPDRPADGAVHLHRLRRLGTRRRGDHQRLHARRRRASCAACGSRSSPAGCCSSRSPPRSRTTTQPLGHRHRPAARPDLHRRRRDARSGCSCSSSHALPSSSAAWPR